MPNESLVYICGGVCPVLCSGACLLVDGSGFEEALSGGVKAVPIM